MIVIPCRRASPVTKFRRLQMRKLGKFSIIHTNFRASKFFPFRNASRRWSMKSMKLGAVATCSVSR
jgi:hypothetical protein